MTDRNNDDLLYLEMNFEQFIKFVRRHTKDWQRHLTEYLSNNSEYESNKKGKSIESKPHPKNRRQQMLIKYFEGKIPLSNIIGRLYTEEITSRNFNEPLLRDYFKQGNLHLENLLFFMLDSEPTDIDLLYDVTFFNFCRPILKKLISVYQRACILETDLNAFKRLVNNFQMSLEAYEFDVFFALKEDKTLSTEKLMIIDKLAEEYRESKMRLKILEKDCDESIIH